MNSCEDLLILILHSYITVVAMKVLGLQKVDNWPSSVHEEPWMENKEKCKTEMDRILSEMVDKFLNVEYLCTSHTEDKDRVFMYSKQLFSIGSLYLEFTDTVKEEDGKRVLCCWRYFLIIFHNSNRKNYAKEAVLHLYHYQYLLSPQQVEQLLFNWFINVSGPPGRNISSDLHMEHLNREVINGIAALGSGKTEKAILSLGKALGTISPVLYQFDKINNITNHQTRHKSANQKRDILELVNHINHYEVFDYKADHKYSSFQHPKSLLHNKQE